MKRLNYFLLQLEDSLMETSYWLGIVNPITASRWQWGLKKLTTLYLLILGPELSNSEEMKGTKDIYLKRKKEN